MTTRTDWRKTCAELIENVRYLIDCVDRDCFDPVALMECREHLSQTRAALAQPEPEGTGLSDEELLRMVAAVFGYTFRDGGIGGGESEFLSLLRDAIARSATPQPVPVPAPMSADTLAAIIREVDGTHRRLGAAALAEAILSHPGSRWSPTIEPVPVAERPWEREGWCNSDNEAFFFDSDTKKWSLCECDKYSPVMTNASDRYTHSLPHNALPVPGAEEG
jgi:hypothetical protein